ncbi:MAG: hypothetical protein QME64_07630 [bacterium]|nr:hypothetical protein [bacterium]
MVSKMVTILVITLPMLLVPVIGYAYSYGPPDARTGAPGEPATCTQCHSQFPLNSGGGIFRFENVPANYTPNTIYPISVRILQSGQTRWGFELKATAGTITVTDAVNMQLSGGVYLKHTTPGTYAGNSSGGVWSFNWQAPSDTTNTVIFYAAGNAANNNGNTLGDYIYNTSTTTFRASVTQTVSRFGSFTTSSDTNFWYFEKYGDATTAGSLSWSSNFAGQSGVLKMTQTPGQKAKLTQIFSVASAGWYTARAKVATDITDATKQQKVYLYLQQLDISTAVAATGNQVVASGAGGFGAVSTWRDLTISFYAQGTLLAVQVVGINSASSGVTGGFYVDEIWVTSGAVQPTTPISLTNGSFDSGTTGWLVETYADGVGSGTWTPLSTWWGHTAVLFGTQTSGEKAKISQLFNLPSINTALASVWVYSGATTTNQTQKVYLYVYSYDNGTTKIIESGNAILQPGKWTPNQWRQVQFGYTPLTQFNAVQVVGINPVGRPNESIFFDEVVIKQ